MTTTIPCPACGAPVAPAFGKKQIPCPYCGTLVQLPESAAPDHITPAQVLAAVRAALQRGDKAEAVRLYSEGMGVSLGEADDAVTRLQEERNTYPPKNAYRKYDDDHDDDDDDDKKKIADALRKAQPIAMGALNTYAWWSIVKRFVPGCLVVLSILCLLACVITVLVFGGVLTFFNQG